MNKFGITIAGLVLIFSATNSYADSWGAIAYSPKAHGFGFSRNGVTQKGAQQTAMKRCAEKGL